MSEVVMRASDSRESAANSSKAFNAQSGRSSSRRGWSKFEPAALTRVCSRWPEATSQGIRDVRPIERAPPRVDEQKREACRWPGAREGGVWASDPPLSSGSDLIVLPGLRTRE